MRHIFTLLCNKETIWLGKIYMEVKKRKEYSRLYRGFFFLLCELNLESKANSSSAWYFLKEIVKFSIFIFWDFKIKVQEVSIVHFLIYLTCYIKYWVLDKYAKDYFFRLWCRQAVLGRSWYGTSAIKKYIYIDR